MKKRIVILQNTDLGGHLALSTFLTGLLKHYKSNDDFSYDLICGYVDQEDQIGEMRKHLTIHEMGTVYNKIKDNLLFTRRSFWKLVELNREKKIDIVHGLYPNSSLQAMVLFRLFVNWKVKIIYDVRSPWIEMSFANAHLSKGKGLIRWAMHMSERILTRFVDYFVFISEGTKEYYAEKYALGFEDDLSIIPTGVDVHKFSLEISEEDKGSLRERIGVGSDDIVIGYVGTISQMREMSEFLRMQAKEVIASPVNFLMIGDGDDLENMREMVRDEGLSEKFIFMGKMKQSELIPYMHIFDYGWCHLPDIFVFRNSFPLKILEYLSIGLPILCSDIKAHRSIQDSFPESVSIYDGSMGLGELKKSSSIEDKAILKYDWKALYGKYLDIYLSLVHIGENKF